MRYLGGKFKIRKYLIPFLNRQVQERPYYEPFVGGANVIEQIVAPERFGMDIHDGLIKLYQLMQTGWTPPSQISEDEYQSAMAGFFKWFPELETFILFGASYGGRYRGGYARGLDDNGRTRNYAEETRDSLVYSFHRMKDVIFSYGDVFSVPPPRKNMMIYCDPPYRDTTPFIGTGRFDHDLFYQTLIPEWIQDGHLVLVSGYDVPSGYNVVWSKERKVTVKKDNVDTDEPRLERVCVNYSQTHLIDRQIQTTFWEQ